MRWIMLHDACFDVLAAQFFAVMIDDLASQLMLLCVVFVNISMLAVVGWPLSAQYACTVMYCSTQALHIDVIKLGFVS